MTEPRKPSNEVSRLQDLYHYEILDTAVEEEFDMLVELASRICETPISLLTLVDDDRQWFKAKLGIEQSETERRISFCAHAILQNDLFVVNDATKDDRFHDNPLVTDDPSVRFYAGAQIRSAGGHKLGTLCVIDSKPRELTWHQASALKILSTQASRLLELRYLKSQLRSESPEKEAYRKQQALSEWTAQQAAFFASAEEELLEPLKTGRFTKKELTAIYLQSKDLLQANKRFGQLLSIYNADQTPTHRPELVNITTYIEELHRSIHENSDRRLPLLSIPDNQITVAFKNSEISRRLIRHLLETFVLDFGQVPSIQLFLREDVVEVRMHLLNLRFEGFASAIDWGKNNGGAVAILGAYNLKLLQWVAKAHGGSLEIHNQTNAGSDVFLTLQIAKQALSN